MSLTRQDISIYEGADFQWEFDVIKNPDGTPFDLTDATVKIDIRPYPDCPILYLASTVGSGNLVISTPTNGKILWNINNTDSLAMGFLQAFYDVQITAAGKIYVPGWGLVNYTQRVTI